MSLKVVPDAERVKLREIISELTERMVTALDKPPLPPEQGKETASLAEIRATLDQVCAVYRLLHGTGDLDTGGSALNELERKFHGGTSNSRR